jgi:diphthine synthase
MLSLVGLGLNDEKDLTLKGLDIAKKAKKVYIELYTGYWHGNLKNLDKIVGKKISVLKRKDLEDDSGKILAEAKKSDIVIFVQGDPLVATTHGSLILDARKMKIKTRIIHNASIVSAIAETGLHLYKFGQIVTIPFPEKTNGIPPQSVYDIISRNKLAGLHTLCLLDVVADEKRYMLPQDAVKILLELEKKNGKKVFTENTEVIVAEKLGSDKPIIKYKRAEEMLILKFESYPAVLIIPGKLHFTEREFFGKKN